MDVRRAILFAAAFAAAVSVVVPAAAERVRDDEDVRGPFDISRLIQDERRDDELKFTLVTHGRWTVRDVKDGGFAIRVDSDRDNDYERYVLIEWNDSPGPGGDLKARIVRRDGSLVDRVPARHPRPKRLSLWLDRRDLAVQAGTTFHVNAYSVFFGDRCPDDGCRDFVPDEGRLALGFGGPCQGREPDITGTDDDDTIVTEGRRIVVASLGGDDVVRVGRGSAIVCGGDGRDLLVGGGRADLLIGGDGPDEIRVQAGGQRANEAFGGGGNDLLYGGDDSDRLFAGRGDDYATGRGGNDFLDGGRGNDDLRGGPGTDTCVDGSNQGGC